MFGGCIQLRFTRLKKNHLVFKIIQFQWIILLTGFIWIFCDFLIVFINMVLMKQSHPNM